MPNDQPIIPPESQSEEEKELLAEREHNETKLAYYQNTCGAQRDYGKDTQ